MSDRFDHTLERKLDTKPDGSDEEPRGVRRIELITGTGRRRHWPTAERSRILLESLEPGVNVSEVARRNGLSPQQLFGWRREARSLIVDRLGSAADAAAPPGQASRPKRAKAKGGGRVRPLAGGPSAFAPIMIAAPAAAPPPAPSGASLAGLIDIVVGDCVVRVRGLVDAGALATVLKAVRRSS